MLNQVPKVLTKTARADSIAVHTGDNTMTDAMETHIEKFRHPAAAPKAAILQVPVLRTFPFMVEVGKESFTVAR